MTYHELLKEAIKQSGWSMREISRRCEKKGVKISQGYLSQLCRNKVPPASEKVNKCLEEVLSIVSPIELGELVIASYREKIPQHVVEAISN